MQHSLIASLVCVALILFMGCRGPQPTAPATGSIISEPTAQAAAPTDVSASAAMSSPTPNEESSIQDDRPLAARVNGQPIFLDVYQKQVAQTEKALFEQGAILEGEEGQAQLTQIRQNVLNGLIEQAIIEQAAAAAGIVVTDEELEATVQHSIATGQGQASLDQWLADNDMTMETFREIQRSQLIAGKMIEYVTTSVPTTAEQVHARHIRTADRAGAQALLDQLKSGANFAALAQQASQDVSTAANGGDLGWFPRDVPLMPPQVVEVAFALPPGEISDVLESEQGYHIVKVEAREANRPLTPEMLLYLRKRAFEAWLSQQWQKAAIQRYVDR